MTDGRSQRRGELLVSLGLIALGACVLLEAQGIEARRSYEQLGPRLFPDLIGAGLLLLGGLLTWQVLSGGWRLMPAAEHPAADWPAFGLIGAGLVLHMALIGWAGFAATSALLFALVARGLGSRRPARDLAIGLALAAAAFYFTTMVLQLQLPPSPLGVI
jgi:putative tricarboxylic transport membrane protein